MLGDLRYPLTGPWGCHQATPSLPSPIWTPPTLPKAKDPISPPWDCQPLPHEQVQSPALHSPGSPSQGPCWAKPTHILIPREVPDAWGWGCPSAPWMSYFWLGQWDGPWMSGPMLPLQGAPITPGIRSPRNLCPHCSLDALRVGSRNGESAGDHNLLKQVLEDR